MNRIQHRTKLSLGIPLVSDIMTKELVINEVEDCIYFRKSNGNIVKLYSGLQAPTILELNLPYSRFFKTNIVDASVSVSTKIAISQIPNNVNMLEIGRNIYAISKNGSYNLYIESKLKFGGLFTLMITKL